MKKIRIIYWVSTIIISAMMLMSAAMYFTSAQVKAGFTHLGYPDYFRVELALAKLAGLIVLLVPLIKGVIKEWAYFGFFITFVSALIAHINSGDPSSVWFMPVLLTFILGVSWWSYHKIYLSRNVSQIKA